MSVKNRFRDFYLDWRIAFIGTFPSLARQFYKWFWKPINPIEKHLCKVSEQNPDFRFLQIGANDGIINDPILKLIIRYDWRGIRIEPISIPFERLSSLHKRHPRVSTKQFLVGTESGNALLHQLSFSNKRWATGLATLNRNNLELQIANGHVAKRAKKFGDVLPEDVSTWIDEVELPMQNITDLIKAEFGQKLNLLQIDVEGFDHVLVNSLNFELLEIDMICFEKLHIPMSEIDDCLNRLKDFGYHIMASDMDILAYKTHTNEGNQSVA